MMLQDLAVDFNTVKFIEVIKAHRPIWDMESKEYAERDIRNQQWEDVINIYGGCDLTIDERKELGQTLQKKWKNIRDNFVRDLTRRNERTNCGKPKKSNYIYFNNLLFLKDIVLIHNGLSESDLYCEENENPLVGRRLRKSRKRLRPPMVEDLTEVDVTEESNCMGLLEDQENDRDEVQVLIDEGMSGLRSNDLTMTANDSSQLRERDECEVFGELVAMKLRKLGSRAKSIVQYLITDTLFDAEMGKYDNIDSSLVKADSTSFKDRLSALT